MQGCFNICKIINIICHTNIIKDKITLFCQLTLKKPSVKFNICWWKKTKGILIKAVDHAHIANIILNREKTKAISSKMRKNHCCPLSPLLYNKVLKVVGNTRNKKYTNMKHKGWISLFADQTILYLGYLKDSKRLLDL